ncbi:cold shock domain-containing protein [Candidatus Peregrinibacteria bacterium]|jgi:cold shock protein|nr:cold shock domain-containing protein [Candidatus Peregrinibacteria bacterium]
MQGTIKKLDERKFGFITVEGEKDVFFHSNECEQGVFDTLKEGDSVTFDKEPSDKGPKAVNVRLAEAA